MKSCVDIDDFLTLLYWVKMWTFMTSGNDTNFKYQNLLEQAQTYELSKTQLDTRIHPIDLLMIDAYQIYDKTRSIEEEFNNFLSEMVNNNFYDLMIKEYKNFQRIFEDLLENYKYEDPEIVGIQLGYLKEKMNKYVLAEDYENAARIRNTIVFLG